MVIINITKNKPNLLEAYKKQNKQKKPYTGRLRMWLEIPDDIDIDTDFIDWIKRELQGTVYKSVGQIKEFMIRHMPELKGKEIVNILVQDLDEYKFTHAGYDKLTDYILLPDIKTVQALSKLNEKDRRNWRKARRNEAITSADLDTLKNTSMKRAKEERVDL